MLGPNKNCLLQQLLREFGKFPEMKTPGSNLNGRSGFPSKGVKLERSKRWKL